MDNENIINKLYELGYSQSKINQITLGIKTFPEMIDFLPDISEHTLRKYRNIAQNIESAYRPDIVKLINKFALENNNYELFLNEDFYDILIDNSKSICDEFIDFCQKMNNDIYDFLCENINLIYKNKKLLGAILNCLKNTDVDKNNIINILIDECDVDKKLTLLKCLYSENICLLDYKGCDNVTINNIFKFIKEGFEDKIDYALECDESYKINAIINFLKKSSVDIDLLNYNEKEIVVLTEICENGLFRDEIKDFSENELYSIKYVLEFNKERAEEYINLLINESYVKDNCKKVSKLIVYNLDYTFLKDIDTDIYSEELSKLINYLKDLDVDYANKIIEDKELLKDLLSQYYYDYDTQYYFYEAVCNGMDPDVFPYDMDLNYEVASIIYDAYENGIKCDDLNNFDPEEIPSVLQLRRNGIEVNLKKSEKEKEKENLLIVKNFLKEYNVKDIELISKCLEGNILGEPINPGCVVKDNYSKRRQEIVYRALYYNRPSIMQYADEEAFEDEQIEIIADALIKDIDVLSFAMPLFNADMMRQIIEDMNKFPDKKQNDIEK